MTHDAARSGDVAGASARVDVDVYDVNGRLVRRVARDTFLPGVRTLTWDGRDTHGQPLGTGIYFVRLSTVGRDETVKLTVLR